MHWEASRNLPQDEDVLYLDRFLGYLGKCASKASLPETLSKFQTLMMHMLKHLMRSVLMSVAYSEMCKIKWMDGYMDSG